jgi:hypothetical protein
MIRQGSRRRASEEGREEEKRVSPTKRREKGAVLQRKLRVRKEMGFCIGARCSLHEGRSQKKQNGKALVGCH